jgi:hypothetical protein
MGCYKVNFGDYCLAHYDSCKYFNYFEFNDKKYPIGAYVNLTQAGQSYFLRDAGYGFIRGGFRLVDHLINDKGVEMWTYFIGKTYETGTPVTRHTTKSPDELISVVLSSEIDEDAYAPGELQVTFKEPNYFPKDWEVEGVMFGWFIVVLVWIFALVFKDWWITLLIQIGAGWYFSSWREKKINEAISTQKFKE